jgi:hypothetical protein
MRDLAELQFLRQEIQRRIARYVGTPDYEADEKLYLQLQIARLERDIIDIKITLINTTNDEERRHKEQQIETKEQQIETKEQLLHDLNQLRLLPPQQMVVAKKPGN